MSGNQSQVNAGNGGNDGDAPEDLAAGQVSINSAGTDDLLDEIDGLLENNAEEFVRAYVQKGGE
ncbi:ubiquitin-like protein Pup [Corynebacterium striatum]|uniref:Prokaryotic ubiquitin-like protein Pup n=1 Tax=Corynebacterium striatum TaxID=43770 RepID=A0A2Z2IY49_CORST|nr:MULTISPECIES: ubiquitin-like protein Pup [Corynebacterium]ART21299.1 ubiquitin-like protein Pup [Corynebacterium striatum]KKO78563.1 ubiquitin [Corynebacterium striatum]MBD0853673.1 ubiquitin-like protein Pup [Corynebacterium striatum]MDK7884653.1 ubiquitin-like protein Pup [Corynebacterium striatum]MDK8811978.1 ubiquitin-like protein Pup [Corynebacterium striatum]